MKSNNLTILDRLNEIIESIELIEEWSNFATNASDFMLSPNGVMAFNACVMRLQVIGEDVGKLETLCFAGGNVKCEVAMGLPIVAQRK